MLIGPAVVGALFGAFAAFAVVAMHSEYGDNVQPRYPGITNWIAEATLDFIIVTTAITFVFGVIPLMLWRFFSRRAHGPDA